MPTDRPYDPTEEPELMNHTQMWDEYNSGKKPLVEAIMSNYTKPTPQITPEQAEKAKFGAAMTDTFSTLAEMFAHSQGGRVQPRSTGSSTGTTNARLQALQDKYAQDQQQYGAIHSNAIMQDFNRALETERYNNNAKRTFYLNKQQQQLKADALQRQIDKDKADKAIRESKQKLDEKQFGETKRHNQTEESLRAASISKSGSDNSKRKFIPVYLNGKQRNFPEDLIDEVVSRAIKDKLAGQETVTTYGVPTQVDITPSSKLSAEQKRLIFQNIYPKYLTTFEDGSLGMKQSGDKPPKTSTKPTGQMVVPQVNPQPTKQVATPKAQGAKKSKYEF